MKKISNKTPPKKIRKLTLFIEGKTPNYNEFVDAAKRARIFYSNGRRKRVDQYWTLKKKWTDNIKNQVQQLGIKMFERPVRIKYTWYRKARVEDPDNISGGGRKVVLDGLVEAGILRSDGWRETGPGDSNTYVKCAKGEKEGVLLEIQEVEIFAKTYDRLRK